MLCERPRLAPACSSCEVCEDWEPTERERWGWYGWPELRAAKKLAAVDTWRGCCPFCCPFCGAAGCIEMLGVM
jgi:hypothetical protein